jgi:hypothetical protein
VRNVRIGAFRCLKWSWASLHASGDYLSP